jgi:hypothetical protein
MANGHLHLATVWNRRDEIAVGQEEDTQGIKIPHVLLLATTTFVTLLRIFFSSSLFIINLAFVVSADTFDHRTRMNLERSRCCSHTRLT